MNRVISVLAGRARPHGDAVFKIASPSQFGNRRKRFAQRDSSVVVPGGAGSTCAATHPLTPACSAAHPMGDSLIAHAHSSRADADLCDHPHRPLAPAVLLDEPPDTDPIIPELESPDVPGRFNAHVPKVFPPMAAPESPPRGGRGRDSSCDLWVMS